MDELEKLETKFKQMGFVAELDFSKAVLCVQIGDLTEDTLKKVMAGLKRPKFDVKWYTDICGDLMAVVEHRRFLNGWW